MMDATFHILGLAHQPVTPAVPSCAYTMKVIGLSKMLKKAGARVYLYHAGSMVQENIATYYTQVVGDQVMAELYGQSFATSYNQNWHGEDEAWRRFRIQVANKLSTRIGRKDPDEQHVVLCSFGNLQESAMPSKHAALIVELGVGYEGVFADHKVFESYAWQHFIYGKCGSKNAATDTVIPNYLDPEMFDVFSPRIIPRDSHGLYLGRVVPAKGVEHALAACQRANIPLRVIGKVNEDDATKKWFEEKIRPFVEYVPMVGVAERTRQLLQAKFLICPTQYIEPFGGVAVEAAYCATPVISSDTGGFTETVINGRTGFRVRDVPQMISAIQRINEIDPEVCHAWGENFTLDNVWPRYAAYFEHHLNMRK